MMAGHVGRVRKGFVAGIAAWAVLPLLPLPLPTLAAGAGGPTEVAVLPAPAKAVKAAPKVKDPFARAEPILLSGARVEWRDAAVAEKGMLHVAGLGAPSRRWVLEGTSGQAASTTRVKAGGEVLAFADRGWTAVVFFMHERTFGRQMRSSTKDSRKGWALLKRSRPVETGTGRIQSWFSPLAFTYDYTLVRIAPPEGERACAAFHGRRKSGGSYAGSVGGFLCAPPGTGLGRAELTRFLDGIRVGSGLEQPAVDTAPLLTGSVPGRAEPVTAAAGPAPAKPAGPAAGRTVVPTAFPPTVPALPGTPAPDDGFWDRPFDGPVIDRAPQPSLTAVATDDAQIADACTPYLGDQAVHLRCQWLTGPDRADYIPAPGREAPLAVLMRCHPLREEPTQYAACISGG